MRILTLGRLPALEIGGLPQYTAGMAGAMAELGNECCVVHPGKDLPAGTYPFATHAAGDDHWPNRGRAGNFRKAFAAAHAVRSVIADFQPDVLHVQYGGAMDLAVLPSLANLGVPTVVTAHCGRAWVHLQRAPRLSARRLVSASLILVLNQDQRSLFVDSGLDPRKLRVIGTLIEGAFFQHKRRIRPMVQGPRRCLYLGRIAPEKGLETVIRAIEQLPVSERPRFKAVGPIDPSYEKRILEMATGLGPAFELLGPVDTVEQRIQLLDEADCLLHPTLSDVKPLVVLEAMARELPILASGLPGTVEMLSSTGQVFAPGDSDSLRQQLAHLHRDPNFLGPETGRAGRAVAMYSTPSVAAAETLRHFETCLEPAA